MVSMDKAHPHTSISQRRTSSMKLFLKFVRLVMTQTQGMMSICKVQCLRVQAEGQVAYNDKHDNIKRN